MTLNFIVKLGGAAITDKSTLETLDAAALAACARNLKAAYDEELASFIVVHGAGSFGHFQASRATVAQGQMERESVRTGFVDTRYCF